MHHRPQLQPISRNEAPFPGGRRKPGIGYSWSLPVRWRYRLSFVASIQFLHKQINLARNDLQIADLRDVSGFGYLK